MKYYFNKYIEYLENESIEISPYYFLILKKIKELIESEEIEKGQGKMSKKLKEYFFDEFNISEFNEENINIDLNGLKFNDIEVSENDNNIERIDTVQIKNFRGFGEYGEEDKGCCFDFKDKNKIILYGPNGSGKSCFAEALEYSLTGSIKECIRKGKNISKYVKNKNKSPDIFINGEKMDLSLGEKEKLKKCFIEKNRITEFSLFKSEDTGVKDYRAVLTLLLGLGELNGFIGSFVQKDSFSLSNEKEVEKVEKDIEDAEKNIKDKKAIFIDKKNKLEGLKTHLIGIGLLNKDSLEKNNNILDKLKSEIEQYNKQLKLPNLLKNLQEIKKNEITDLKKQFGEKSKELEQVKKELEEKKTDINMKKLYEAIRNLSVENKDVCPACHTKKENWEQDPFDNADKELKNMDKIIELENKYDTIKELVEIKLPNEIKSKYMVLDANILKLQDFDGDINRDNYFEKLEDLVKSIDKEKIEKIVIDKDKKQQELQNIEYDLKQYDYLTEEICKGEPSIDPEKKEEMELKLNMEKNKDIFLKNINDNYGIFHENIDEIYNNFIKQETENLRNNVCEYYKKINKHDNESEQIVSISTKEGYDDFEILLHFTNGEEEDAVNYLSEGHLKALGLAILRADMKKNNVPFMIFDDVVNAIDAEHRSNIIEILHTDEFLSSKQLILTVHDRLFWEKYCNMFGTEDNSWRSIILKHNNTVGINYEVYNEINYQEKIEFSIEKYDLRQAIVFMRILLETEIYAYLLNKDCDVKCKFEGSNIVKVKINSILGIFRDKIGKSKNFNEIEDDYNFVMKGLKRIILNQESHAHSKITYNIVESSTNKDVSELFRALKNLINFIHNDN